MPTDDDLKKYATSTEDFYALLDLPLTFAPKDLDRAWRRAALRSHPDKAGTSEAARAKFHLVSIAYEILGDASLKSTYDTTRSARLRKQQELEKLEAGRRQAREDLERREREGAKEAGKKRGAWEAFGFSSGVGHGNEREEQYERNRIAEENQKVREAFEEKIRVRREEEEIQRSGKKDDSQTVEKVPMLATDKDRLVKVRLSKASPIKIEPEAVTEAFEKAHFGRVEKAWRLPDKDGESKKKKKDTVWLLFESVLGAHAAVERSAEAREKRLSAIDQADQDISVWRALDKVEWAGGKEPAVVLDWMTSNLQRGSQHLGKEGGPTFDELAFFKIRYAEKVKKAKKQEEEEKKRETDKMQDSNRQMGDGRAASNGTNGHVPAEKKTVPKFASFKPGAASAKTKTNESNGSTLERLKLEKLRHEELRRMELKTLDEDENLGGL